MSPAGAIPSAVRWTARITSLGVVGLAVLALARGTWPNPASDTVLASLADFFLLSACAGLLLAWLLEGSGGTLAVGSVGALYVVALLAAGRLPEGWLLSSAAVNGFLFILSRALHAARSHETVSDS